jgi:hypothetical protein
MATAAFALLVLGTLVGLGRPPAPLTTRDLPAAVLRGMAVLSRLSDRRRERLRPGPSHRRRHLAADRAVVVPAARSGRVAGPARTP